MGQHLRIGYLFAAGTHSRDIDYGLVQNVDLLSPLDRERSDSLVECLTRDRGAAGSSLTGVTVLWSLSKTHLS